MPFKTILEVEEWEKIESLEGAPHDYPQRGETDRQINSIIHEYCGSVSLKSVGSIMR